MGFPWEKKRVGFLKASAPHRGGLRETVFRLLLIRQNFVEFGFVFLRFELPAPHGSVFAVLA